MESGVELAGRIYQKVLKREVFVRCRCHVHDKGPYAGNIDTTLDVLNLCEREGWQAVVLYHFKASAGNTFRGWNMSFSLVTDSDLDFDFSRDKDTKSGILPKIGWLLTNKLIASWRPRCSSEWVEQGVRCSVTFNSGGEFGEVSPSHQVILPGLVSAYANLKAEFFARADEHEKKVPPEHSSHVKVALDSLLCRYSVFVAQAMREQVRQLFGTVFPVS